MNWDNMKKNWKDEKGNVRKKWDRLSDDEMDEIQGQRDVLVKKIHERYGIPWEEAEAQVKEWEGLRF